MIMVQSFSYGSRKAMIRSFHKRDYSLNVFNMINSIHNLDESALKASVAFDMLAVILKEQTK